MNEQLDAVIVIYFQYEYFRVAHITIKIHKLQIKNDTSNVIHIKLFAALIKKWRFYKQVLTYHEYL